MSSSVSEAEKKQQKNREECQWSREKWTYFLPVDFAPFRPSRYWIMPSCLGDNEINPLIFVQTLSSNNLYWPTLKGCFSGIPVAPSNWHSLVTIEISLTKSILLTGTVAALLQSFKFPSELIPSPVWWWWAAIGLVFSYTAHHPSLFLPSMTNASPGYEVLASLFSCKQYMKAIATSKLPGASWRALGLLHCTLALSFS